MDVLYFAWVRERIGHSKEQLETDAKTVRGLMAELIKKGDGYRAAFADETALRVAVDQELSDFETDITNAREVAFFPPMTGG